MVDNKLKSQFDSLKNSQQRGNITSYWQETAEYVFPSNSDFWTTAATSSKGHKKNLKIYDSTAVNALGYFASLLESLITPRHIRYHSIQTTSPKLNENRAVAEWLEAVCNILFAYRYRTSSNFQSQIAENYMSIGAFGNGAMFIDQAPDGGLYYKSLFIGDFYPMLSRFGELDIVYYRFDYTHHQANERWGEQLPSEVAKEVDRNPFDSSSYVHCVRRSDDSGSFKYDSYYFHESTGVVLQDRPGKREGYRVMPYTLGRYRTSPREVLGRGPAMESLPDIRSLNEMEWTSLRMAHKLADPVLLAADDGVFGMGRSEILLDPGEINFGGVSAEGRALIQPLQTGGNPNVLEKHAEQKRSQIREAFMVNLFQILVDTPRMTATEALQRAQEKGAIAGPVMGRVQSEQIGPTVRREIDVLRESGLLPDPPAEIRDLVEAGQIDIIFESPLARLQRMEELTGIDVVIQQALQMANAGDRSGIVSLDGPKIMGYTAKGSGAPVDVVKPAKQVQQELAQEQAAAAAQQNELSAREANQASQGVKNLAQAEALRRGSL